MSEVSQFIGAWLLADSHYTLADGTEVLPFGHDARGAIFYTPDGWMACQLEGGDAERRYSAYCGRFSVDEGEKVITHHVHASSDAIVSGDQARHYHFDRDTLILEAEMNGVKASLSWKRAEPQV